MSGFLEVRSRVLYSVNVDQTLERTSASLNAFGNNSLRSRDTTAQECQRDASPAPLGCSRSSSEILNSGGAKSGVRKPFLACISLNESFTTKFSFCSTSPYVAIALDRQQRNHSSYISHVFWCYHGFDNKIVGAPKQWWQTDASNTGRPTTFPIKILDSIGSRYCSHVWHWLLFSVLSILDTWVFLIMLSAPAEYVSRW